MNFNHIPKSPLVAAAAAGFLGFALRALLYRVGFDERGILSDTHPLHLLCLVLTGVATLYAAFLSLKNSILSRPHPTLRFLLGLMGGYFLAIHTLTLFSRNMGPLELLRFILTALSAISMVLSVLPFLKKGRILLICLGLISICFALDILCRYRSWSGNPQLPDYFFHLLAGVALNLGSYHTLALHTGLAKPRVQSFYCLIAMFLCLLCLVGPDPWEFYLGSAFWAAACVLTPQPEDHPQEESDVPA